MDKFWIEVIQCYARASLQAKQHGMTDKIVGGNIGISLDLQPHEITVRTAPCGIKLVFMRMVSYYKNHSARRNKEHTICDM